MVKIKTKAGIVIGSKHQPAPQRVVDVGTEMARVQRALLARRARWLTFEGWLQWFNEAIAPLMWTGALAAIAYGLMKGLR